MNACRHQLAKAGACSQCERPHVEREPTPFLDVAETLTAPRVMRRRTSITDALSRFFRQARAWR